MILLCRNSHILKIYGFNLAVNIFFNFILLELIRLLMIIINYCPRG